MSGGGGNPDYSSSVMLANILQGQESNFKALYRPIETQALNWATNPNTIPNAQAQAGMNAGAAGKNAAVGLQHTLESQGVTPTSEQQQAISRRFNTSNALNTVDAMNRAGMNTYDTITNTLTGSAPPPIGGGMMAGAPAG